MTDNMRLMHEDILYNLNKCFPKEYLDYCFGENYPLSQYKFAKYLLFELVYDAYEESLIKEPLRHFIPYSSTDDDHSERMRFSRSLQYTQSFTDKNYQILANEYKNDPKELKRIEVLKAKDMSGIKNRLEGYELNKLRIFEHETLMELPIVKSIIENRITSPKKVSNKCFVELFEGYDDWVEKLRARSSENDEEMLFASISFFLLEWKYSLEFFYVLADYMDEAGIKEIDPLTFNLFYGVVQFFSRLSLSIRIDSRMIIERQNLALIFLNYPKDTLLRYRGKYAELLGLACMILEMPRSDNGVSYSNWFRCNTNLTDWASFIRDYDVFQAWNSKTWTKRKIQIARNLLKFVVPFSNGD